MTRNEFDANLSLAPIARASWMQAAPIRKQVKRAGFVSILRSIFGI